jgi:hypothetical protein
MIEDRLDVRRAALAPVAAPAGRIEYAVRMEAAFAGGELVLLYVPDRHTLHPAALDAYLALLHPASPTEEMGLMIMEDLVNELVCRWLRVTLTKKGKTIILEDRQPQWSNPDLLSRLPLV